jgi:hypothetical protein
VEYRGISFQVTEVVFPSGWRWAVNNGSTISVGVCGTRADAIQQARAFIDAIVDWAA